MGESSVERLDSSRSIRSLTRLALEVHGTHWMAVDGMRNRAMNQPDETTG